MCKTRASAKIGGLLVPKIPPDRMVRSDGGRSITRVEESVECVHEAEMSVSDTKDVVH